MTKQVLGTWNFHTLEQLFKAVADAVLDAKLEGRTPDIVNIENCHRIALVEETLTDGSKVLNLYIHPGEADSEIGKTFSRRESVEPTF